jgi:hypothetical protein
VLAPSMTDAFAPAYALPLVAELAFCVWLLRGRLEQASEPDSADA